MRRHLGTLLVTLAALAAVVVLKTAGQPAAARGQFRDDPPPTAAYERACTGDPASPTCALLHGAMRARALEALTAAEAARDQRYVAGVLGYLDLADEPELQAAACRVVAQFPEHPGAMARVRPLLFGDYPTAQRAAAHVLASSRDATDRHLAAQWQEGHRDVAAHWFAYRRASPQIDPARVKLTRYPGAQRFAPADALNTVGLATTDPLDRVVAYYARATGATPLDFAGWQRRQQEQLRVQGQAGQAEMPDLRRDPDLAEVERLAKEYQRTRNPALLRKIQAVSQRLQDKGQAAARRVEQAQERTDPGLLKSYSLPGGPDESPLRTARFLVAEQRGTKVVRLVVVYREAELGKTVIQLVWDLASYRVPQMP